MSRLLMEMGLLTALVAVAPAPVRAATVYYVGSNGDASSVGATACQMNNAANGCALREAIALVNAGSGGDEVRFATAGPITLTSPSLTLSRDITLTGPTAGTVTVTQGNAMGTPHACVFTVGAHVTASISNLTISGGTGLQGGGILVNTSGTLTLTNSTVRGNSTGLVGRGGGILNSGTLTLTNSTLNGNTATFNGGGISNDGTVTLTSSTVSGNTAGNSAGTAGGIFNSNGTTTITGSIVAGNGGSADVVRPGGTVTDGGTNLIGTTSGAIFTGSGTTTGVTDPLLLPLGDYGGPTQTMPPRPGSFTVAGGNATCPTNPTTMMPLTTDQRGLPRPVGRCDIGAVEYTPVAPTLGTVSLVGTAGQPLALVGTGFQHGSTVAVDGSAATDIAVNADGTRLSLRLPAHAAGIVPFTVTNPGAGNGFSGYIAYAAPAVAPTPHGTAAPNATRPAATAPARTPGATPGAGTPTPAPQPTRRQG